MRTRTLVVTGIIATGLLVTGAVAQREEHQHGDQAAPAVERTDTAKIGGMMSQMPQMMTTQKQTAKLVSEITTSFAAIEAEKDPAALKQKLVAHGALLKELQAKIDAHSALMEMMQHMMGGSMMNSEPKK